MSPDIANPESAPDPLASTWRFLELVMGIEGEGLIEFRMFKDGEKGPPTDRAWYRTPAEAAENLPFLLEIAVGKRAGVFFGVLRRRAEGAGTAEDTISGRVVWADIDFKHFPGGEAEARQLIASFPLRPTIITRTGHGLHLYWVLREPASPTELSAASKAVAKALRGDHVSDRPRVMRLPGTFNWKNPGPGVRVEIEEFCPERLYNLSELHEALELVGCPVAAADADARPPAGGHPPDANSAGELTLGESISQRVQDLIANDPKVRNYFVGGAKFGKGPDGQELDTSSSGFDFSFLLSLIRRGVTDPVELATAVSHRPDGKARAKGAAHIARDVARALAYMRAKAEPSGGPRADFTVERVTIYTSNPPQYEFVINGVSLKLTSGDLQHSSRFEQRVLEALHRVPSLPDKRGLWIALVNNWLSQAERVEQPPEASEEGALREAVEQAIEGLRNGDDFADLDRGLGMLLEDGRVAFKSGAVLSALQAGSFEASRGAVCRVLRELGYESATHQIATKKFRVWTRTELPEARAREES